ncbi:MAG: BamA/TamA family outer membrane protein [Amphritea sp.]
MNDIVLQGTEDEERKPHLRIIPFAFYNDSTELAISAAVIAAGYYQPQLAIVGNAFTSSNGTSSGFLLAKDLQLHNRLFLDTKLLAGDFGEIDSYQDGNPAFPNERAGSNDSHKENFINAEGTDNFYRLNFRYVLPTGDGAKGPIHKYVVDRRGLLVPGYESGGREWNPFTSGRLIAEIEFFYRKQELDNVSNQFDPETLGATFAFEYDNSDFYKNPSKGSRQRITISHDWGSLDDTAPWTSIDFEASKYFSFGETDDVQQRVLALNMWWIDSPTWNSSSTINGSEVFHRPPLFSGATLGGLDRLKGYSTNRFNDRSAVFYAAEYRHMPKNNPFKSIPYINKLNIPWWQWVVFAEAGRVHDEWDLSELHDDMKWDAGLGVRLDVEGVVVRLDVAQGEEDTEVQMFIGHTF